MISFREEQEGVGEEPEKGKSYHWKGNKGDSDCTGHALLGDSDVRSSITHFIIVLLYVAYGIYIT